MAATRAVSTHGVIGRRRGWRCLQDGCSVEHDTYAELDEHLVYDHGIPKGTGRVIWPTIEIDGVEIRLIGTWVPATCRECRSDFHSDTYWGHHVDPSRPVAQVPLHDRCEECRGSQEALF